MSAKVTKIFGYTINGNTSKSEYQYILSLNEANLKGVETILTPEEYEELVTNNVILELTDESNAGKLLGIQVDVKYNKEQ